MQRYLERIEHYFPGLDVERVEVNSDGLMNDVRQRFEPLLQGRLDLRHTPALIHGDLGQQHILFDPATERISGVLDWGIAGLGDPAHDYGVLISCYGERFVRRMAHYTPEIGELIDRARFMSYLAEPSWVLRGLRSKDPFWFTVSLGTARDIRPIGSGWE